MTRRTAPRRVRIEDLLTVDQAAEVLHVHRSTIARWLAGGVLERVRMGGRVYLDRHQVEEALETNPARLTGRRGRQ